MGFNAKYSGVYTILIFSILVFYQQYSAAQGPFGEIFGGPPGGGFGGPGGPPPFNEEIKVLDKFDKDGDQKLNSEERKSAREYLKNQRVNQFRPRGFPGPGFAANENSPKPGKKVTVSDVKFYPDQPLYASNIVRTIFIEFESKDWEKELEDFHNTDVDVPARLIVDGKTYNDVGIHFRGSSSYMMVPSGFKRSLTVSMDAWQKGQNLYGYRTLHLLNAHEDPSFIRSVLFLDIARNYIPAPKANFVRVVINGEDWGIYVNQQHINKEFIKEWFASEKGARWKTPGSPLGRAGLEYRGDNYSDYKKFYEIKSKEDTNSWNALIHLCKVLNTTSQTNLIDSLSSILDIDNTLKFLALEIAFINNDGYWVRASDYYIYLDKKGLFHIIPFDANETFSYPQGPGFDFSQSSSYNLDPLIDINDKTKPLRSVLLSNPELRRKYLNYVKELAEKWMDWERVGKIAEFYHSLIDEYVKEDAKKLCAYEEFKNSIDGAIQQNQFRGFQRTATIKEFVEKRRKYLLDYKEIKNISISTNTSTGSK